MVNDDDDVDLINLNTVKELQAAIAERDATIERLRSELEAEQARTICAMCGEDWTRMASQPATQAGTWQPINNSKVRCTQFDHSGANQHGDWLTVWYGEEEASIHLPDDVRLCRKVTP